MNTIASSTSETDWLVGQLPAQHAAIIRTACDATSQRQAAQNTQNTQNTQNAQAALMREAKAEYAQERRVALVVAIEQVIARRVLPLDKLSPHIHARLVLRFLKRTRSNSACRRT